MLRGGGGIGESAGNSGHLLVESRGSCQQSCRRGLLIFVLQICRHVRRTFGDLLGRVRFRPGRQLGPLEVIEGATSARRSAYLLYTRVKSGFIRVVQSEAGMDSKSWKYRCK